MATGETESPKDRPPVPDPTTLTTEQMLREVANLEKFLTASIAHEAAVCSVQFKNVEDSFGEIAKRTAEQKADTKAAVDAALQAAKEAVAAQTVSSDRSIAKSEAGFVKEIDSLKAQVTATEAASSEKLNDVKARLDRIEAGTLGGSSAVTTSRDSARFIATMIGLGVTVLLAAITIAAFLANSKP